MSLQTRRILFYLFAVLFIFIGTVAIFYSSGWRFDLATFKINRLGALFLKITPGDVTISIEKNKFEFSPGFLKSGTLIANLFPKTYTIKVTKEDYQPWTKEIRVYPSLVTEVPPVLLLPDKLNLGEPIDEKVNKFWAGPKYLISLKNTGLEFQGQKILGDRVIRWSEDGTSIITRQNTNYFLINLNKPDSALNLRLVFNDLRKINGKDFGHVVDIDFHPSQNNKFIVLAEDGLYVLDTGKLNLTPIQKGTIRTFTAINNEVLYEKGGLIFIYNLAIHANEPLTSQKFNAVRALQISPSGYNLSILEDSGTLFVFNRRSLTNSKIAENALNSIFSPNSKKIALINNRKELIIYPIYEPSEKTEFKKPAVFRIGSLKENSISWHANSAYLFIKYPSTLYLLESSSFPPINFQVIDLENSQYQYQGKTNALYLLKGTNLYNLHLE